MFEKINDLIQELKEKSMLKYKKKYHKSKYCLEEINQNNTSSRKKMSIIISNLYSFYLNR